MLSTAGVVPVAQEFCGAGRLGSFRLEFSPVSPECPSAMMPRSGCDAGEESLAVAAGGVAASWVVVPDPPPHEAFTINASPAVRITQTRERTRIFLAPCS